MYLYYVYKLDLFTIFSTKNIFLELQTDGVYRNTVKPVQNGHSQKRPEIGFQDQVSLNAVQNIAECPNRSIMSSYGRHYGDVPIVAPIITIMLYF